RGPAAGTGHVAVCSGCHRLHLLSASASPSAAARPSPTRTPLSTSHRPLSHARRCQRAGPRAGDAAASSALLCRLPVCKKHAPRAALEATGSILRGAAAAAGPPRAALARPRRPCRPRATTPHAL
ncbi:unnamed protein product, partial [Closterium sp. NIES-53]